MARTSKTNGEIAVRKARLSDIAPARTPDTIWLRCSECP